MKRIVALLFVTLTIAGCGPKPPKVVRISPEEKPVEFDEAPAQDPVVEVTEPGTLLVTQGGEEKIRVEIARAGRLSLSLRLVDDSDEPMLLSLVPRTCVQCDLQLCAAAREVKSMGGIACCPWAESVCEPDPGRKDTETRDIAPER